MTGFNLDKVDPLALSRSLPVVDDGKGNLTLQGEPVYLIDGAPEQGYRVYKGAKACGFYEGKPVFRPWDFYLPICHPDPFYGEPGEWSAGWLGCSESDIY